MFTRLAPNFAVFLSCFASCLKMEIGSIQTLECGCFYHLMLLILIYLLTASKWLLITSTSVDHRFVI